MKANLTVSTGNDRLWEIEIDLPIQDAVEYSMLPVWTKAELVREAIKPIPEVEQNTLATEASDSPTK